MSALIFLVPFLLVIVSGVHSRDLSDFPRGPPIFELPRIDHPFGIFEEMMMMHSDPPEKPNQVVRPEVGEFESHGLGPVTEGEFVRSSGNYHHYRCKLPEDDVKKVKYRKMEYEQVAYKGLYGVTKCECVDGDDGTKCFGTATKRMGVNDDRCIIRGATANVKVDMECKPLIIDITVNTEGHGTFEDITWETHDVNSRPYAKPKFGPKGEEKSWKTTPVHPLRISCPEGYTMIACHANYPRQQERSCPIRARELKNHKKFGVFPPSKNIDDDQPLIYKNFPMNICQTTEMTKKRDKDGRSRLDPFIVRDIQARCLLRSPQPDLLNLVPDEETFIPIEPEQVK